MNPTPLNPYALTRRDIMAGLIGAWIDEWDDGKADTGHVATHIANRLEENGVTTLAADRPVVTGEQVNLAGWTCNGVHEPGDYSTCEECRDACDDLARLYNHMMRNPRPFKHWTGHPEVNSVESLPAKMRMLAWEGGEFEVGEIPEGHVLVGFEMATDRAWSMADKVTIRIERKAATNGR